MSIDMVGKLKVVYKLQTDRLFDVDIYVTGIKSNQGFHVIPKI